MNDLETLIERARKHVITPREREAQVRSFVYGNTHLENASITRAEVDRVVTSLAEKPLTASLPKTT